MTFHKNVGRTGHLKALAKRVRDQPTERENAVLKALADCKPTAKGDVFDPAIIGS